MNHFPDSIVKVTDIKPCGENKVCITMELWWMCIAWPR